MRKQSIGIWLVCTLLALMCCAPMNALAVGEGSYVELNIGKSTNRLFFTQNGQYVNISADGASGRAAASIEDGKTVLTLTDAKWASEERSPLYLCNVDVLRVVGVNDITFNDENYNGIIRLDNDQANLTIEGTCTLNTHGVAPILRTSFILRGGVTMVVDVNVGEMYPRLGGLTLDNATLRYTDTTSNDVHVETLTLSGGSSMTFTRPNAERGIWVDELATITDSTLEATGSHAGIYVRKRLVIPHLNSDNYLLGTSSMSSQNDQGGLVVVGYNEDSSISMGNAKLTLPEGGKLRKSTMAVLPSDAPVAIAPQLAGTVQPTEPPTEITALRASDMYHILSFSAKKDSNAKIVMLSTTGQPQSVPKTGDSTPIALWLALLAIAGAALTAGLVKRCKQ